jgi:hypothetical protein
MAFNINQFNSILNQHGVQKGTKFRFRIIPPSGIASEVLSQYGNVINNHLEYYCRSVTLPEFDVDTAEIQNQGFGGFTRRPQGMNFPVLPAVFNVDKEMSIVKYFQRWTQLIINYDRSSGNYGNVGGALPFEMGYKQDYATVIMVDVMNDEGGTVCTYEFSGAYPINVGTIEAAWANNDELLTMSVGFTFDVLKVSGSKSPNPSKLGQSQIVEDPLGNNRQMDEITNDAEQRRNNVAPTEPRRVGREI